MNSQHSNSTSSNARRFGLGCLVGIVAMALLIAVLSVTGVLSLGGSKALAMEGEGFATPEQAVDAYLDAMRSHNTAQMVSSFAMESYVEHYQLKTFFVQFNSAMALYNAQQPLPNNSEVATEINLQRRYREVVDGISRQYFTLMGLSEETVSIPRALKDTAEIEDFLRTLDTAQLTQQLPTLKRLEFVDPVDLLTAMDQSVSERLLEKISERQGAQQTKSIAAQVQFGDETYLFCFDTICFDDKWYLLSSTGSLATLLKASYFNSGILAWPIPSTQEPPL